MIGLCLPLNKRIWKLLLLIQQILQFFYASKLIEQHLDNLQHFISQHHLLFKKSFKDLKPKHHYLIGYPNVMRKLGPMKSVTTRKFEYKHKESKNYA